MCRGPRPGDGSASLNSCLACLHAGHMVTFVHLFLCMTPTRAMDARNRRCLARLLAHLRRDDGADAGRARIAQLRLAVAAGRAHHEWQAAGRIEAPVVCTRALGRGYGDCAAAHGAAGRAQLQWQDARCFQPITVCMRLQGLLQPVITLSRPAGRAGPLVVCMPWRTCSSKARAAKPEQQRARL